MPNYIPTTQVVRTDYIRTQFTDVDAAGAEFDRWLDEVVRQAKEEAWYIGASAAVNYALEGSLLPENPYEVTE